MVWYLFKHRDINASIVESRLVFIFLCIFPPANKDSQVLLLCIESILSTVTLTVAARRFEKST